MGHCQRFFREAARIAESLDHRQVERMVDELVALRARGGRLFLIGVGGSAANCSHAVNDFRKLCGIEAYTPVDNVSELTARVNDEGWGTVFESWLKTSQANENDAVLVFSVGGGDAERNVSANIVAALDLAKARGLKIFGVIGRDSGYTNKVGDEVVVIPTVEASRLTPHTEAFQAVVWHCIVSHPALQQRQATWEKLNATDPAAG
ncbi:MAG: SIS domain-containing protein [Kiloniellales bacterium]